MAVAVDIVVARLVAMVVKTLFWSLKHTLQHHRGVDDVAARLVLVVEASPGRGASVAATVAAATMPLQH